MAMASIRMFLLTAWTSIFFAALSQAYHLDNEALVMPSLDELPQCAALCFLDAAATIQCGLTDATCLCSHSDELTAAVQPCVLASCTTIDQLRTQKFSMATCGVQPVDDGRSLLVRSWALFSVACFACFLRLISRLRLYFGTRSMGADDVTVLLTLSIALVLQVLISIGINIMLGKDIWTLGEDRIIQGYKLFYISEFLFTAGAAFSKLMVLSLYLRIFTVSTFRRQCHVLLVVVGLYFVAFSISSATLCRPISYFWTNWDGPKTGYTSANGTCGNGYAQINASFISSAILDVVIFLMPIPQVMKLQMTWMKKLGISLTFALGLFVTACSVVRTVYFITHYFSLNPSKDYAPFILWTLVELHTSIICFCIPALSPMFRRMWSKYRATTFSLTKESNHSYSKSKQSSEQSHSQASSGQKKRGAWHGFTDVMATQDTDPEDDTLFPGERRSIDSRAEDTELGLMRVVRIQGPPQRVATPESVKIRDRLSGYESM